MATQIGPIPEGRSVGTAVTVDADAVMGMLTAVQAQLGRTPRLAAESTGSVAAEYLRAEGRPLQRIESGLMRRSWTFRLRGRGGTRVEIGNTARSAAGEPYPAVVNARFRVAQRIIGKHYRQITAAAVDDVLDGIHAAATTRQLGR